jgi:hypothetical protein
MQQRFVNQREKGTSSLCFLRGIRASQQTGVLDQVVYLRAGHMKVTEVQSEGVCGPLAGS